MSSPDYNIIFREVPQNINQINQILGQALTSKGRSYLVVDQRSNTLGITNDKSKASSMLEIAVWMNQLSDQIAFDKSIDRGQIGEFHLKLSKFVKQEAKNKNFVKNIFNRIFSREESKQTQAALDNIDATLTHKYGKQERPDGKPKILRGATGKGRPREIAGFRESRAYAKHAEELLAIKMQSEPSTFESIKDKKNSRKTILRVFEKELRKEFRVKGSVDEAERLFEEVLGKVQDDITKIIPIRAQGPQKAIDELMLRYAGAAIANKDIDSKALPGLLAAIDKIKADPNFQKVFGDFLLNYRIELGKKGRLH